jgi:ketosteroid isomerase-like protein
MGEEAGNVELIKQAYKLWHDSKGGSVDHFVGLAAEDIKFGSIARGAEPLGFTAAINNRETMRGYFEGLLREWQMLHYDVHQLVAQDDMVFARCSTSWRNKKTGKTFDTPKADFWRLRDGKIVEFYEYFDTAQVMAAAT